MACGSMGQGISLSNIATHMKVWVAASHDWQGIWETCSQSVCATLSDMIGREMTDRSARIMVVRKQASWVAAERFVTLAWVIASVNLVKPPR